MVGGRAAVDVESALYGTTQLARVHGMLTERKQARGVMRAVQTDSQPRRVRKGGISFPARDSPHARKMPQVYLISRCACFSVRPSPSTADLSLPVSNWNPDSHQPSKIAELQILALLCAIRGDCCAAGATCCSVCPLASGRTTCTSDGYTVRMANASPIWSGGNSTSERGSLRQRRQTTKGGKKSSGNSNSRNSRRSNEEVAFLEPAIAPSRPDLQRCARVSPGPPLIGSETLTNPA